MHILITKELEQMLDIKKPIHSFKGDFHFPQPAAQLKKVEKQVNPFVPCNSYTILATSISQLPLHYKGVGII